MQRFKILAAFLAALIGLYFGGLINEEAVSDISWKVEKVVSQKSPNSPAKCDEARDEGRHPPLTPDGVFSPVEGDSPS
jgi:hypothetical protein